MKGDLKKIFDEQNAKILKNKIMLDIDNNTDSLKLTIFNIIMLEMNKLVRNISKFCDDNAIIYDDRELEGLIVFEKEELKSYMSKELEFRQQSLKNSIEENNENRLTDLNDQSISSMKNVVSKEMAIQFLPKFIAITKIEDEENLIRINGLVRLTSSTIQDRIEKNTKTRFLNLVNMIDESKSISLDMVKKTGAAIKKIENADNTSKRKLKTTY